MLARHQHPSDGINAHIPAYTRIEHLFASFCADTSCNFTFVIYPNCLINIIGSVIEWGFNLFIGIKSASPQAAILFLNNIAAS